MSDRFAVEHASISRAYAMNNNDVGAHFRLARTTLQSVGLVGSTLSWSTASNLERVANLPAKQSALNKTGNKQQLAYRVN